MVPCGLGYQCLQHLDADYQLQVVGSPTMIVHGFTATTPFDPGQPLPTPPVFVPGNGNVYVAIFMSPLPTILGPNGQYQVIVTNPKTGHSFGCSAQLWQNEDVGVQPVDNVLIQELEPGQPAEIVFEVQNLGEEDMVPVMRVDQMFGADGEELAALRVDIAEADRLQVEPLKAEGVVRVPVKVELMENAPKNGIGDVILFVDVDGDGEPDAASSVIVRMADGRGTVEPIRLPQPLETMMGDVSCDGKMDSIDALLQLQFNIGLRDGAETCPVDERDGRAVYLPACDLNDDGDCGSIDALFVLQCDIGLPNMFCPEVNVLSNDAGEDTDSRIEQGIDATQQQTSTIHLEYPEITAGGTFTMTVMADTDLLINAVTLKVVYDRTEFETTGCQVIDDPRFGMGECNPKHPDDDMAHFNIVMATGISGTMRLADIGFKHIGNAVDTSAFDIDIRTFADGAGQPLNAIIGDTVVVEPVGVLSPEKFNVYLPLVDR